MVDHNRNFRAAGGERAVQNRSCNLTGEARGPAEGSQGFFIRIACNPLKSIDSKK
jgi:hypothetical protein